MLAGAGAEGERGGGGVTSGPGYAKHPNHTVAVAPAGGVVRVSLSGQMIAETDAALELREATYPPVLYVPLAAVRPGALTPTDRTTYCPFKGEASYWTVSAGGETCENAAWGYKAPYDEVAAIKDHVAFYTDKVKVEGV